MKVHHSERAVFRTKQYHFAYPLHGHVHSHTGILAISIDGVIPTAWCEPSLWQTLGRLALRHLHWSGVTKRTSNPARHLHCDAAAAAAQ